MQKAVTHNIELTMSESIDKGYTGDGQTIVIDENVLMQRINIYRDQNTEDKMTVNYILSFNLSIIHFNPWVGNVEMRATIEGTSHYLRYQQNESSIWIENLQRVNQYDVRTAPYRITQPHCEPVTAIHLNETAITLGYATEFINPVITDTLGKILNNPKHVHIQDVLQHQFPL